MRKRAALSACIALLCALSLAGCGKSAANLFTPKTSAASTSATAPAGAAPTSCETSPGLISACVRLGDFATLDPCSLIGVGALPADLAASPADRNSLDDCEFSITAGTERDVVLEIGDLASGSSDGLYSGGEQQLGPGGLDLEEGTLSQGECDDALDFAGDQIKLKIAVFALSGNGSQALCDAANEVGKALGDVMNSKTQFQHFTVPGKTIATMKACALVGDAHIGNYQLSDETEHPSGHSCEWTPDPGSAQVELGIDLAIGTKLDAQTADSHSRIDGIQTYTLKAPLSDYARCEVDTYRAPWGNPGAGLFELPSVWVIEPPGQIETACSLATQLATVVWPKLPPISS
ncbi:MAG TPA: hypothetical protein VJ914_17375 [Pseudonocardiaceae bacterium]|nr:hypothetical protein [Pseudonocardiaceae bacterium]